MLESHLMSRSPFLILALAPLCLNLLSPTRTTASALRAVAQRQAIAQTINATVISTGDGDTLRVDQGGQSITVRLSCIDSAEASQPGGQAAADRLRQLLPRGQSVQIIPTDTDRYGRTVGVVFANGRSINLQMVQEGHAVVYRDYLNNCPNSRNDLLAAEAEARSARRNFWAQSNAVMPWDWRRGVRSVPSSPAPAPARPTPAQTTSNFPPCVNSDCDCSDFRSQAEAQRVFNAFPGDPFRLDRDGDGRVCEGR
ncbi:thermonuclease family protein [Leptolyngbya ohadii]|uniref:thermonuclease family protein n=1 Tax=Leptolyngbya ohadii TaxID=1962290 RepID=UPI001CED55FF|nr:thermonuclease family protein [Leptolyngbya ohadii]